MPRRRITQNDIDRFSNGSCYQLAKAIFDITGWDMCGFYDEICGAFDTHAFVKTPWKTYLDIKGEHTQDELCEAWGEDNIRVITDYETEVGYWDEENPHFDSMPRARELAPELVRRFTQ
jgi:hypothetical protein